MTLTPAVGSRVAKGPARVARSSSRAQQLGRQGRADGRVLFRTIIRGTVEGAEGAEETPGNQLAAFLMAALAGGRSDFLGPPLAEVVQSAKRDAWAGPKEPTAEERSVYFKAFVDSLIASGVDFSTTKGTTVGDFLDAGDQQEELRWRLALAASESFVFAQQGPTTAPSGTGRFVVFQYCISIGIATFTRPSAVKYIPPGGSVLMAGLPYTMLSLIAGWWGIPFGPIFTVGAIYRNLRGGLDVTEAVTESAGMSGP
jgi:hypothetical protein